jgi:glycosyltransferase involved in cell wall biosynthesis
MEHSKRQDVLITAYANLPATVRERWSLVLAGGADESADTRSYIEGLRTQARGLNIRFEINTPQETLRGLYDRASLFWHATGFGRPPEAPERAEHFGITVVEAMSWGAVPIAYRDGGVIETVDETCGVLWTTEAQLVESTLALTSDPDRRRQLAANGVTAAQTWSPESFATRARQLFSSKS